MSASLPFAAAASRLILPKTVRSRLYHWFLNRRIEQLPSRRYLDEAIFPTLAEIGCRSVLFAGVRSYNRRCLDACRERGIAVWTIDIDPTVAQLGAPGHHIVGDLCSIDRLAPHLAVDATIVNGIFG